jgi:hypothetical protein
MSRLVATLRENWLTLAVVAALAVAFMLLRTPASALTEEGVLAQIESTDTTVIYFYSNT